MALSILGRGPQNAASEKAAPSRAGTAAMTFLFTSLDALVSFAKARAQVGVHNGKMDAYSRALISQCTHKYHDKPRGLGAIVIYSRDVGHHSSGWWKNPDYERCLHLSLSVRDPRTGGQLPRDTKVFEEIAQAFFGEDVRKAWLEGPYSPEGKRADCWHYRVFCDTAWNPIMPRHEVYSREFTETGWKSFSEIHETGFANRTFCATLCPARPEDFLWLEPVAISAALSPLHRVMGFGTHAFDLHSLRKALGRFLFKARAVQRIRADICERRL
jgi:hypothetical protein